MAGARALETMQPNPARDAASYPDVVDTLVAADHTFKVWSGDWCGDRRGQLPDFATALDTAGVPAERIDYCPVEKADDGPKIDPLVEGYGIELAPTVVVKRDGEEVIHFMEEKDVPTAVYLVDELSN